MKGYFDYAATCPIDKDALNAYVHAAQHYFANTQSLHDRGTQADDLLEHCREKVARLIGGNKEGIYFTSGGTESNELAIDALMKAGEGRNIITTEAEHSSVRNLLKLYEQEGCNIINVPLLKNGTVDTEVVRRVIDKDTIFVLIQHVNADIGSIQPIREISEICRQQGVLLHSDCVQSFGKVDVSEISPFVDSLSISSHKVYGPKGVGAVYICPSLSFLSRIPNGTHENGRRPGTVNIPGIAGFTVAAEKMIREIDNHQQIIFRLKKAFLKEGEWEVVGEVDQQPVPILGILLPHMEGQWAMLEGNRQGYHFSTGSACREGKAEPSGTLSAMGYEWDEAKSFIRISFSHHQTEAEVKELAAFLKKGI
ncbi:cysteine desulfurase [Halobacillus karajensis]|uniref:Cysteine desulfurase NifS n=1 Tax=Halobacillus karajensis TaxID=195088 RepID=A0A024P8Y9_9BACI|nr:IscS subfamily cysteine desulfurase [Halobacillus karajensis]CDQ21470.1 Putative cysteine desulfurase NifS [Halobacillus karajensis]CDQ25405.1 Putative cysteine desulfurase NifS [Halobacillus karajensis]CDQ29729.1 Putative cysteine desulfurase NifS [Halobacillus karajensis]SEI07998.1 cysteine desulfurase [Halobacillus karajensis]